MQFAKPNRIIHRWGSLLIAIPLLLVILTGLLLQLKKESAWIQPATRSGISTDLTLDFDEVLALCKTVPEAQIKSWDDVERLDVRPSKGILKVQAANHWEIQVDTKTAQILQVAFRRSDFIESLHDGSFFSNTVKLWVFLPSAVVLLVLWVTGVYLFILPYLLRGRRRRPATPSQPNPMAEHSS
ncbi:MAG: PepSY domain-containing protein [Akkermansiaceae bacterium]|nr:PepSY domain-containing protein [Akkermansiaceae bacterium]MCF7732316.1 PepSY domain-containing protein [Akkermansiaceae bacterium]